MASGVEKHLFVAGIIGTALGQLILNLLSFPALSRILFYEAPIDYGHWLLLISSVVMTPFAVRRSSSTFDLIAGAVLLLGIVCVIGMNVLDLVMWSLSTTPMRQGVLDHLSAEPSIWIPFITLGPTYLFVTGLVLPSLAYFRVSRLGVALVVGSSLVFLSVLAGFSPWFFVIGYGAIAIGYLICFAREPEPRA